MIRMSALFIFPIIWIGFIHWMASDHGFYFISDVIGAIGMPLSWLTYYFDDEA